jgi:hypothetical protein
MRGFKLKMNKIENEWLDLCAHCGSTRYVEDVEFRKHIDKLMNDEKFRGLKK